MQTNLVAWPGLNKGLFKVINLNKNGFGPPWLPVHHENLDRVLEKTHPLKVG